MDTSTSPISDADNVCIFLKLDGSKYPPTVHQKNTVIKYTKIPDFDFDTKVSWPSPRSYTLQPRLRRIIGIDDDNLLSNRSLRSKLVPTPKYNEITRKIATIPENEEYGVRPKLYECKQKLSNSIKAASRTIKTGTQLDRRSSNRIIARLSSSAKSITSSEITERVITKNGSAETTNSWALSPRTRKSIPNLKTSTKETKTSAKPNSGFKNKEMNITQLSQRGNQATIQITERTRQTNRKVSVKNSKSGYPTRSSLSKNFDAPNESDEDIKKRMHDNLGTDFSPKRKSTEKPIQNRLSTSRNKNKFSLKNFIGNSRSTPITVTVPRDNKQQKYKVTNIVSKNSLNSNESVKREFNTDCASYTDNIIMLKHVNVGTDPQCSVDQLVETDVIKIENCKCDNSMQTECIKEVFDSLEIPNVTLTKDKSEVREKKCVNSRSSSLPNLKMPPYKISPLKEDISSGDISICESASYVYSHATLTYTARKKINFHVVGNEEEASSSKPSSTLIYPMTVMSVLKNELKNKQKNDSSDDTRKHIKNVGKNNINNSSELNSLDCSYLFDKLMKPSEIISAIKVNNGLLENDYICEQFQRELNFIDSFFASLQYLENCSLSENKVDCFMNNSVLFDPTYDANNSVYNNFLSKLENGTNIDDSETMASKSLCLLNLLIRDEQRRAKNLLFVLKMREDALKDFTKSQILWLEKKKKRDNTDISTLKKKQRGALLKLQHECGEMQRMRKALLALSEKRKVALIKTKKNIELKLNSNVDVDNIILGKKKLKRTSSSDRNASPLKCFDLSSSGCEESTSPKPKFDVALLMTPSLVTYGSAEKCVQTADVPGITIREHESEVTAENFVAVDGGYLNIIFNDLALPQIFSSGKQYEVNERELTNIVCSSNNSVVGTDIVEKLMEQIKDRELHTSSPSTARSLVDEFDQYYRGFAEDDKCVSVTPDYEELDCLTTSKVLKNPEQNVSNVSSEVLTNTSTSSSSNTGSVVMMNDAKSNNSKTCICELVMAETQTNLGSPIEEPTRYASQITGPLPVPVGAAAVVDCPLPDFTGGNSPKSPQSSGSDNESVSSQPQSSNSLMVSTPVQCEAEELRRQQLAIEREIKALEQQQSRMLVVREIPDKPPPPYTPPTEIIPKPPRMFAVDEVSKAKIENFLHSDSFTNTLEGVHFDNRNSISEPSVGDAFDIYLADFCQESIEKLKQDTSDNPWDACNLLPQKPQGHIDTLVQTTSEDMKEVLTNITTAVVAGVSGRRSDHIDDILFNEWRRCEPEWTSLHTDEAIVKNQVFDSIFQKILTETINEYKKNCASDRQNSD